ncbi:MAG: radical SAM protein, partial [Deltaproteobacteria bacterium]|nr:radical SAM protein [Deltaproteobacteria bacterium]
MSVSPEANPAGLAEKIRVWRNVYQRIRFFKKMYPLSVLVKDAFLFPLDYALTGRPISRVRNVTVAITHKCNLRCEMCYFQEELADRRELPLESYARLIDSVKKSRPCIILSGGEPLTHPDLLEMVALAKRARLPVQIFTNGTLVRPKIADKLVGLGLDYIDFTLLGDAQSHPLVARSPKAYEQLTANLEHLAKNRGRTRIVLNYTVTPRAVQDIGHALKLVKRFELDGLRIQHYNFLRPK